MTRTTERALSSRVDGTRDTFATRLANEITRLIIDERSQTHLTRRSETLEQAIARAIYKELPR